jgi:hypothetical protein
MKIIYGSEWENTGARGIGSIANAVEHAATPSAYSYDGKLEKLAAENEKLRELVGRLCECIFSDRYEGTKAEQLEKVLGYNYTVKQE